MAEAPSRRQVLAAGAWSVPVVALAIGAPGAAASPSGPSLHLVLDWLPYDADADWPPPAPGDPYDGPVVVLLLNEQNIGVPGVPVVFVLSGAHFDNADGPQNRVYVTDADGSALAADIYVASGTAPGRTVVLTASTADAQTLVVPLDVSPPAGLEP